MAKIKPSKALMIGLLLITSLGTFAQDHVITAFSESYLLENQKKYREAAAKLLVVYQTDSYEINLRLGWLYYQGGAMPESIQYYTRAVTLKPYAIEPRFGIVLPLAAQGRWNEVIAQYTRILETDPQNTLANYRIGLYWYNTGNYLKAETHLEKVINLFPFDYDSLLLFAWTKFQLGKMREAKVLFNKVLMHSPGDTSAIEGLNLIK